MVPTPAQGYGAWSTASALPGGAGGVSAGDRLTPWAMGLLATTLSLRLSALRPFTFDEYHTWHQAGLGGLGELVDFLRGDVHPWMYLSSVWAWARLVPTTEVGLRSLSALCFGLATVAFWWTARRLLDNRRGATMATLLLAVSPVGVAYGAQARAYALGGLLAILLLWTAALAGRRNGGAGPAIGAGVVGAALFYTHYTGLFFLMGVMAWWGIQALRTGELRRFLVAGITASLLIGPWIPVLLAQRALRGRMAALVEEAARDPSSLSYVAGGSPHPGLAGVLAHQARALMSNGAQLVGVIPSSSVTILLLSALPAMVGLGFAVRLLLRRDPVVCMGITIASAVLLGVHSQGLLELKFVTALLPVVLLVLAHALAVHWEGRLGFAARAAALGLVLVSSMGTLRYLVLDYQHPAEALVEHVRQGYREGDVVVFHLAHAEVPFAYHARQKAFAPPVRGFPRSIHDQWGEVGGFRGWSMEVSSRQDLRHFVSDLREGDPKGVWLVLHESERFDPGGALPAALDSAFSGLEVVQDPAWEGHYRLLRTLRDGVAGNPMAIP